MKLNDNYDRNSEKMSVQQIWDVQEKFPREGKG
jgi:hypothetical protein